MTDEAMIEDEDVVVAPRPVTKKDLLAAMASVIEQESGSTDGAKKEATALLGKLKPSAVEAGARLLCAARGGTPDGPLTMGGVGENGSVFAETGWHAYSVLVARIAHAMAID